MSENLAPSPAGTAHWPTPRPACRAGRARCPPSVRRCARPAPPAAATTTATPAPRARRAPRARARSRTPLSATCAVPGGPMGVLIGAGAHIGHGGCIVWGAQCVIARSARASGGAGLAAECGVQYEQALRSWLTRFSLQHAREQEQRSLVCRVREQHGFPQTFCAIPKFVTIKI